MEKINALQTAELSAAVVNNNFERYVDLINENIKPPVPVTVDNVIIRAMYIISDETNSYGGKFDRSDLPDIARLFIDSPVMIGHDKSGLPVARNFWAETVEKGDRLWVKSYFYWLKNAEGSEKLRLNIDSGIYKECSVSFIYGLPECSACGGDIRECGHQISDDIFFYYRNVEKILETSLVYRGSIPDTTLTDQLAHKKKDAAKNKFDLNHKPSGIYTLTPALQFINDPEMMKNENCFNARINHKSFILVKKGK